MVYYILFSSSSSFRSDPESDVLHTSAHTLAGFIITFGLNVRTSADGSISLLPQNMVLRVMKKKEAFFDIGFEEGYISPLGLVVTVTNFRAPRFLKKPKRVFDVSFKEGINRSNF